MKVLVTGFDPFGGESMNPSWEAVKRLPDWIAGAEIRKAQLRTAACAAEETIQTLMREEAPQIVLCVGQAGRTVWRHAGTRGAESGRFSDSR